jgi:succinate dehydrogenase/fumarate reductase cytochrome b subunit
VNTLPLPSCFSEGGDLPRLDITAVPSAIHGITGLGPIAAFAAMGSRYCTILVPTTVQSEPYSLSLLLIFYPICLFPCFDPLPSNPLFH